MHRIFVLLIAGLIPVAGNSQGVTLAESALRDKAQGAAITSRRITLSLENVTVEQAIRAVAQQAKLDVTYSKRAIPPRNIESLKIENASLEAAFGQVLKGTGLSARMFGNGQVDIIASAGKAGRANGVIAGKITDAKTGRAISGATISVASDARGVSSGEDGAYRLTGVPNGNNVVTVRLVGYAKQTKTVTIGDGATVTIDFRLESSANVLDQVIVTGTIVQTELKAVPNAITVITAKQIEDRGITRIDQLFRGDVPGLFAQNQGANALLDEVTMFSRGVTSFGAFSGDINITNPIKTYVDGVEMADPKYLSQIDPKSIERIEILTGPQASTIYGSNAMNGVMQIFTKRGSRSRPQVNLSLISGWVENNFSNSRTPQHEYSAQVNGLEGRISYNIGGSWDYMGPWTPARQFARTSEFGGVRFEGRGRAGSLTGDATARRGVTRNRQLGSVQQTVSGFQEAGWYRASGGAGLSSPTTHTLNGQTWGASVNYAPFSWWSHSIGLGNDASDSELMLTGFVYSSPADTSLLIRRIHSHKRSLQYTTTSQLPISSFLRATVTAGADAWQNLNSTVQATSTVLTGTLNGFAAVLRRPGHNTGAFMQTQLAVTDRLFLTYGLRAEWNPDYGEDIRPSYAPRYGVAYTQELGSITAKLRASYGQSTKPPLPSLKTELTAVQEGNVSSTVLQEYGNFTYRFANTELGPEFQKGGEGGVELYFGTRGSLVVTRYNQTVDDLIALPAVDSVQSLLPNPTRFNGTTLDANGYGYWLQYQYLNIGSIRNQGWELSGNMAAGPFTTRGTYSWTKSRTIGVAPRYRSFFTVGRGYPQYQPGATYAYLPEHTWALGVTYSHAATSLGVNVTGAGQIVNQENEFSFRALNTNIRLPQNRQSVTGTRFGSYINFNDPYALIDLTASHRFSSRVEGIAQVQNVADSYTNDFSGVYATMGRQTKIGMRVR